MKVSAAYNPWCSFTDQSQCWLTLCSLSAKHCLAALQPPVKAIKSHSLRKLSLSILSALFKGILLPKAYLRVCASIPYKERHVIWKINWNINFIGRFSHFPLQPPPIYIQIHPLWVSHEHPSIFSLLWSLLLQFNQKSSFKSRPLFPYNY